MIGVARLKWLRWTFLVLAALGAFLLFQTVHNFVVYYRSTRQINLEVVDVCPAGSGEYNLQIGVNNPTDYPLEVQGYLFDIRYEDRVIAVITQLRQHTIVEPGTQYTHELHLTSRLEGAKRPDMQGCGLREPWSVTGRIQGQLPMSREEVRIQLRAGGSS